MENNRTNVNISTVYLAQYKQKDHLLFHNSVLLLCKHYLSAIRMTTLVNKYENKIRQEEAHLSWLKRNKDRRKKASSNNGRTKAYKCICTILVTSLNTKIPLFRDNEIHIQKLLDKYNKKIKFGLAENTSLIKNFIYQLQTDTFRPISEALGLPFWINELEKWNNLYEECTKETSTESLKKTKMTTYVARTGTDKALANIIHAVKSITNPKLDNVIYSFSYEYNLLASQYNNIVDEHQRLFRSRIDIADAIIEAIPDQTYVKNKPVHVKLNVYMFEPDTDGGSTKVKLVLNEDYNVIYKNNLNPGEATVILRGMNKYIGNIRMTFNIIDED
jgi:hypothetical protein